MNPAKGLKLIEPFSATLHVPSFATTKVSLLSFPLVFVAPVVVILTLEAFISLSLSSSLARTSIVIEFPNTPITLSSTATGAVCRLPLPSLLDFQVCLVQHK